MSDATRVEVIQWCRDNMADFINPIFPPPDGWGWAESANGLILTAIFTNTDDADITSVDVGVIPTTCGVQ